ncbi:MAG: GTPase HflX [Candidatus Hodarchaeales archaeon]
MIKNLLENNGQVLQECILLLPRGQDDHQRFLNEEMRQLISSAEKYIVREYELIPNNANMFFSPSNLEEIKYEIQELSESVTLIIGGHLSAKQHINLEIFFEREIVDKFELVLEIFESRAMTEESKLQIELAQLKYQRPRERLRLMNRLGVGGAWHTERTGFWGTGETPLNVLEATTTKRESYLRHKLSQVKKLREKRRKIRKRRHHYSLYVSIVGYTCGGKSTLLNALVNKQASRVSPRLFESLDTKVRSFQFEDLTVFITDTVGFIEDLPTFLIDSFRSTLEESIHSDIILLLIDASEPLSQVIQKTNLTIETINNLEMDNKRILVLNKVDLLNDKEIETRIKEIKKIYPQLEILPLSAINSIEPLLRVFDKYRPQKDFRCHYTPNHSFRSFCHEYTFVKGEHFDVDKWTIDFSLRKPEHGLNTLKNKAFQLGIKVELEGI